MKFIVSLLGLLSMVLGSLGYLGALDRSGNEDLAREPVPDWVLPVQWQPSPLTASSSGYISELLDIQVNLITGETFRHEVYRITAKNTVEEGSKIDLDFDPSYQKILLHSLKRLRNSQTFDQTDLPFRKVQREEHLEEAMYDGRQSWVAFLKDVKVGDTVELSYTIRGRDPLFSGLFSDFYDIQSASPRGKFSFRLTAPLDRKLRWRVTEPFALKKETVGANVVYTLLAQNIDGVPDEGRLPLGFDPYAQLEVSELENWGTLAQWALPRYTFSPAEEVAAKARELTAGLSGDQEKLTALLDFVQDQIRYLGIESDSNSYVPHPPQEVLKNVFGDCKDKAVLFCALAQAVGLKAWPALVSSWRGGLLAQALPSPYQFDHAVAVVEMKGQRIWVDPTRSLQGGPLKKRARDDFTWALVVRPGTTALTPVDPPEVLVCEKDEKFAVTDFQSPVQVTATITGFGGMADDLRSFFLNKTPEDIRDYYKENLQDHFGEVTFLKDPQGRDFRNEGRFVVSLEFRVEKFWQEKPQKKEFETYPHLVGEYLYNPQKMTRRRFPYALEHPVTVRQHQVYEMPEPWKVDNEDKTIQGPGFEVSSKLEIKGRNIIIDSQYRSTAHRVEVQDWQKYLDQLKASRELVGWVFWKDFK